MSNTISAYQELKNIGYSTLGVHRILQKLEVPVTQRKLHTILQETSLDKIQEDVIKHVVVSIILSHNNLIFNLENYV